jgi:hypothetical protein
LGNALLRLTLLIIVAVVAVACDEDTIVRIVGSNDFGVQEIRFEERAAVATLVYRGSCERVAGDAKFSYRTEAGVISGDDLAGVDLRSDLGPVAPGVPTDLRHPAPDDHPTEVTIRLLDIHCV